MVGVAPHPEARNPPQYFLGAYLEVIAIGFAIDFAIDLASDLAVDYADVGTALVVFVEHIAERNAVAEAGFELVGHFAGRELECTAAAEADFALDGNIAERELDRNGIGCALKSIISLLY